MEQKQIQKDHGKDLYQAIIFLFAVLSILWYLKL